MFMASFGWAFILQNMEPPPLVGNMPAPLGAETPQPDSSFIRDGRSKKH
jgi:hypothetical protein